MTDPTTPDTAETVANLRAVISHLNTTIAHLETLIVKAWCLQPGDRVLVMRDTCLSPFGHPPLCGKVVTLKRPCTGRAGDSGIHWYVEEYPHVAMPESSLRPLRASL